MDEEDADAAPSAESKNKRPELPMVDLERQGQIHEEIPSHQQHKNHVQQLPISYSGGPSPSQQPSKRVRRLRLVRFAHLDGNTKAKVSRSVQTAHVKEWLHAHGYVVKAEKLHPAVSRVIEEWFQLVDDDNSRTLEHDELLTALKAAQIPCDDATISEMINLMDVNKDGVIDWEEFEVFMTEEIAAGKSLLSGEYLLPSGTSLNFGVMISKLKRNKLLRDIMEEPSRRNRWAALANNPDALGRELATMQQAVEATTLTLEHLKRCEGSEVRGVTSRTQLASALVRGMGEDRPRGTATGERGRALAEKLRAGLLGQGCELLQHDPAVPEHPSNPSRRSQVGNNHSWAPVRTPRRACPDPIALPLTPMGFGGGFSTSSSQDPFMQMHVSVQRKPQGSSGGEATAVAVARDAATAAAVVAAPCGAGGSAHGSGDRPSDGVTAPGSAISHGVSGAVSCAPASVTSLAWWAGQGPGASASGAPQAAAAAAAAGPYQASPSKPPPQALSPARRSNVPFSPRTAGGQAPSSPAPSSGLLIACAGSRCGSAASRQTTEPRSGGGTSAAAAYRGRNPSSGNGPSPIQGSILPRPGSGLQTAPALERHYLAASTASSRARERPPLRVMSQVSLMAKELRAAPGRYSAEPPGLPAAVLAATGGQWGPGSPGCGAGGTQPSDGLPSATMDGFEDSIGQALIPGCGDGLVVADAAAAVMIATGATTAHSSFLTTDGRSASTPPLLLRSHRSSCSKLPALPLTSHRAELPDFAVIGEEEMAHGSVGRADVAMLGRSSRATLDSGTSSRINKAGATAAAPSLPEVPSHSPMRLPATAAWETPASPRPVLPTAVLGLTAFPLADPATIPASINIGPFASADPRELSSRPSSSAPSLSPRTSCQGQGSTGITAVALQLAGLQSGLPSAIVSGAATASTTASVTGGGKALKPTSIMLRINPGAAAHTGAVTAQYGDTGSGGGTPVASSTSLGRQRRASHGGKQRGSDGNGSGSGTRDSTADGAPPFAAHGSVVTTALDGLVSGVLKGAKHGLNALEIPTDDAAARFRLHHSHDGECPYGREDSCYVDGVGHVWSPGRQSPGKATVPSGDGGEARNRTRAWIRARVSRSGDGAAARHRREAAAMEAVATLLFDSMHHSAAAASGAASSPGSVLKASRSHSSSLPSAPASPDGRAKGGVAPQGTDGDVTSSNCRGGASGSPTRPTQSLIGPPEGRPSSRTRAPLGARGEREDSIDYSWRAATASLLQLHISQQLNDPADGRRS